MDELFGLWFGLIGIVVGAIITFITEIIIRRNQMTFEMSVKIREDLMSLNHDLVGVKSRVLIKYDAHDSTNYKENIMAFKKEHEEVMEAYKVYQIHLGDLKVYELASAIYKYYYELAKHSDEKQVQITFDDYKACYFALKNAAGLMINELRFELIKINAIKKLNKTDLTQKISEEVRYGIDLINWIKDEKINDKLKEFVIEKDNFDPVYKSFETVYRRITPFYQEIAELDQSIELPCFTKTNN